MKFKKQRVVVKVGTSTITHPSGAPNLRNIEILARTLSDLQDMGHEMILVSSGAIASCGSSRRRRRSGSAG